MTPELRQLRYFVAVAEEASFTRAARRLHIAQQSLSQQITVLERLLGADLLYRDSRGTRLTEVGSLFLPEARAVLARNDEALSVLNRAVRGEIGTLHLGFLTTTANYLLPPVVRAVRDRLPDLTLTTDDTQIAALVDGLTRGRYDLIFTRPPLIDGFEIRTLITEEVCAVLPEGHRLAGSRELKLADLADEPWVLTPRGSWEPWHRRYDSEFAAAGFAPRVVQRAATVQGLLGLVAAGVGVTRLARSSHSLRRSGVVFVPLTGDTARTVVAWAPDNDKPALPGVLDIVSELAARTDLTNAG
ncbi:LysR substrate-binding domain-containing protein [Amycolatopsis regifaucium]|uniref:LysR family transcriptional regulator n=1 Tax=Amycolatopsis regifaucium TaxID=546365 RepID=A0A154MWD6_9PSEU|nr:LysR substrate-binding domain-containing protein [Amycolatopsis regifaucium]KZB88067.1 LysR family transcriptional regulator [Amycolatopsis regifaucium]OKA04430.1 LysR family transcriptional regulator [Amycolatopsis regifaucium]